MDPETNETMIAGLMAEGYLRSPAIVGAFRAVPRAGFVPPERKEEAYGNYPLPLGYEQTVSQPLTVAFMLELLDVKPGDKVLDIGAGSGWQAALLSHLAGTPAGTGGTVVAIERIPELSKLAERNISGADIETKGNVTVVLGDGRKGYSDGAPFDRIIASAAGEEIPSAWKDQLRIGGRIVAPVNGSIVSLEKTGHDTFETKRYFGFSFVPLLAS